MVNTKLSLLLWQLICFLLLQVGHTRRFHHHTPPARGQSQTLHRKHWSPGSGGQRAGQGETRVCPSIHRWGLHQATSAFELHNVLNYWLMLREQMFCTQCVNCDVRAHVFVCVRGESELQARKSLVIRAHAPRVTDGDSPLETRTKQTAPPPSIFSCRLSPFISLTLFFSHLPSSLSHLSLQLPIQVYRS